MPDAGETLAVQAKGDPVIAPGDHLELAMVEDPHLSPAVFVPGDRPGEGGVLHGVVRRADRQVTLPPTAGQALGHRPGDQHRACLVQHLQPEVVMEGSGVVLLDHELLADGRSQRVDVGETRCRHLGIRAHVLFSLA